MFLVMTVSVMFVELTTDSVWIGRLGKRRSHEKEVLGTVLLLAGETERAETWHPWSWESACPC